jgi:hypothetical protein
MLPMAPVALFNFAYNRGMLATRFPDVLPLFDRVQFWINSIGFPAGIAIGVLLAYRAIYRWPHPAAGRSGQTTPLLNLGRNLAALSISLSGQFALGNARRGRSSDLHALYSYPHALWLDCRHLSLFIC